MAAALLAVHKKLDKKPQTQSKIAFGQAVAGKYKGGVGRLWQIRREKNPKRGGLHQLMIAVVLATIILYRYFISPLLGTNCRFSPTCSEYAKDAITRYGALRGGRLTVKRILKCHPWGGSGCDPVP